jgi:MFS transporter, DHA2 family, multidrug resistance protein
MSMQILGNGRFRVMRQIIRRGDGKHPAVLCDAQDGHIALDPVAETNPGVEPASAMTGWTPDVSRGAVIGVGVVQGVGLSFLSVPVNSVTLSSLSSEARAEGAGFTTLMRNLGSSIGIAVVNALLTRNTQVNHAAIALHVTAVNRGFDDPMITRLWNPGTAAGRAALDAVITRQAQIIAYIDDYKLLLIATLAAIPLLLVFKKPSGDGAPAHSSAVE